MQRLKFTTYTIDGTWLSPGGVTLALLFGRGGSAGGQGRVGNTYGWGGGGVWSTFQMVSVVPNTSYSITIGEAGVGGTTIGSVLATGGGDSTFGALATWQGAGAGDTYFSPSVGLTFGGVYGAGIGASAGGHFLLGGQKSPFAHGGDGYYGGFGQYWFGGGGAGDGYGGAASRLATGSDGWLGGGGGAGDVAGGNGTTGQVIVGWFE